MHSIRRVTAAAVLLLLLFALVADVDAVRKRTEKKDTRSNASLKDPIPAKSILREHSSVKDTAKKNFKGDTLAYVTPWNNHGYDIAKIFNQKFTYVSPVWLRVTPSLQIVGTHDVDSGWMKDVRSVPKGVDVPKIVPRFHFDGFDQDSYINLFSSAQRMAGLVQSIADTCRTHQFDGVVLDFGFLKFSLLGEAFYSFIGGLASALHEDGREIVIAVSPYQEVLSDTMQVFTAEDFNRLYPYVDKFQIMTYDYSTRDELPRGNAPLPWISKSILDLVPPQERRSKLGKVMMGMNMYGTKYVVRGEGGPGNTGREPILFEEYLSLLESLKPTLTWDENMGEHRFDYQQYGLDYTVCYPSLASIQERLDLASQLGVGIALWEVGQGLDYFYNLF